MTLCRMRIIRAFSYWTDDKIVMTCLVWGFLCLVLLSVGFDVGLQRVGHCLLCDTTSPPSERLLFQAGGEYCQLNFFGKTLCKWDGTTIFDFTKFIVRCPREMPMLLQWCVFDFMLVRCIVLYTRKAHNTILHDFGLPGQLIGFRYPSDMVKAV